MLFEALPEVIRITGVPFLVLSASQDVSVIHDQKISNGIHFRFVCFTCFAKSHELDCIFPPLPTP